MEEMNMNKIRAARISQRLTQQQLSDKSGLSQSYINELENGRKVNPSIVVLDKLASGLNITVADLIEEAGGSISEIAKNIDKW